MQKIIRDNTYLLHMNEEVKNLLLPGPMVSFRGACKLSSYLVRAKLYSLHRKVGSKKCAKNRCEICDYVTDTETFTSTGTAQSFKINHQLNSDDRCIIYFLTCKQCQKHYSEGTTDDFRYRWNNYKSNSRKFDRKESCTHEHLYRHFNNWGHRGFLNDASVTLIDKTDRSGPKKWEETLKKKKTLKTIVPYRLNTEDSVMPTVAINFLLCGSKLLQFNFRLYD